MIRIIYFDITNLTVHSAVDPCHVLCFLSNPIKDFFTILTRGPNGNFTWPAVQPDLAECTDIAFTYLLDRYENMNFVDERVGLYSASGYNGTVDYLTRYTGYFMQRLSGVLVPRAGNSCQVLDVEINGHMAVMKVQENP